MALVKLSGLNAAALAAVQGEPARLLVLLDFLGAVPDQRCSRRSSPMTGRCSSPTRASCCSRPSSNIRKRSSAASWRAPISAIPSIQDEINANGWMIWPPIRYSYNTVNNELPRPAPSRARLPAHPRRGLRQISARRRRSQLHLRQPELARHRRPGPRCGGAAYLRLPHLGGLRPHPDHPLFGRSAWRRARCRAISAAGPIFCSSASSRSGRRCRPSIC